MSLHVSGGTVVTSLDPPAVLRADLIIDADRISAVVASPEALGPSMAHEVLDASGCLVLPGNVNAHMHLYSALAPGMPYRLPPPRDFVQILQRVWWRLDRALDEGSIRASALVGGLEALLSGTTTLIDHHASPNAVDGSLDIVAEALGSLGLRSVCCYEVSDRDGPERARAGLAESERFLRRAAAGDLPLARGMVGAHASFTLSDENLAACAGLSSETGAGLHIHAAEDAADEVDALRRHGTRVARRLADAGALDERTLLAHGVHLDEGEADLVREVGATIAHNPRSNMNNAVGRTPLAWLGDRVALGTDGIGSDMFTESQAAFFRWRDDGASPAPGWPLARLTVGAGLAGRAFGEPQLGRLEPGAPADLMILDYDAPTPFTDASLAGHWIYGLSARWVRDVIVAGRLVVRGRRLMHVDQDELVARARVEAARLWERLDAIDPHPYDPPGA
jgi:putative selenium metabolism protein SsnA